MRITSFRIRAAALALGAVTATATWVAPAVAQVARPTLVYELPGSNVFPEGVATRGRSYYVTSTSTGAVFKGDVTRPNREAQVFLPGGADGRSTAIGIKATPDRLLVAGGDTGTLFVYNRRTGELVRRYSNGVAAGGTFLNDVALDPAGNAYVTDSLPVFYKVPARGLRRSAAGIAPLRVLRSFEGTAFEYEDGFNANGIAITRDGRYALIIQSNTGELFRVGLHNRSVTEVEVRGATLTNGDGLLLQNRQLYVVRNANEVIVKVALNDSFSAGRAAGRRMNPTFMFPTTTAASRGRLLVVNSQFDAPTDPVEPFTVSSIPRF